MFLTQAGTGQPSTQQQDHTEIKLTIEQFLLMQVSGLSGEKIISIGRIDPRLNLTACMKLEPFLPIGNRIWGKTTVGVRCITPVTWTIYLQAEVKIISNYLVTTTKISQGQLIQAANLTKLKGDLLLLPSNVITDENQAIGKISSIFLSSGVPLRIDVLRNQNAVQQGQVVKLITNGPNFQVATEGRALANAIEGQTVQVRILSGQLINGIAKPGGIVEVAY